MYTVYRKDTVRLRVVRKLVPGPGNWLSVADVCNLASSYFFRAQLVDPRWTALAAKLRVAHTIAPDAEMKHAQLQQLQAQNGGGPFPEWHAKCYVSVLARVWRLFWNELTEIT